MKNVSRDDNNYHLVTQAGNQTDHSVHGQYWITIFKDCNKINLICPEDNLFLNSPIGSPSQVLAHPSNWKQQNKFYRKILNVSWNVHSASAYRLFIVISSLFFRFISIRILRKLLDTQTEDMSWFIAVLRREGSWYLNWNAFAEINIHLKSARKTARHPSLCDPPCPRKNQTELISWQPGRVSTFRTRDTRGTKHQRGKWKRYFFLSHHEEELQFKIVHSVCFAGVEMRTDCRRSRQGHDEKWGHHQETQEREPGHDNPRHVIPQSRHRTHNTGDIDTAALTRGTVCRLQAVSCSVYSLQSW